MGWAREGLDSRMELEFELGAGFWQKGQVCRGTEGRGRQPWLA